MKRKRGAARRKPPKKPQVAAANAEPVNSAFQNGEEHSHWDGNDAVDSRTKAETAHALTNMNRHQEACFLEETDGGNSIPKSNLLKNVASFAAKLSRAVGSSSAEPTNNSLPVHDDIIQVGEPRVSHSSPLNNEQELNAALLVIKKIMNMDAAKPFNLPVDPIALGIPDYLEVIDKPMDFGTICNNIEWGGKYRNSKDVYKDVQLIFDNCFKYNKKGDYILDLMKRVKINFTKQWNAAGLYREGQEVDSETNLQSDSERLTRRNKDGHVFPSGSMMSKSVRQEQQVIAGLSQVQRQQCSPCISHTQSQYLPPEYQGEQQSLGLQSLHSHHSGHLAAAESTIGHNLHSHTRLGGPSSGINNRQQPDENRPQQEPSHQPSTSRGSKVHLNERPYKYQPSSSNHHYSSKPAATNTQSAGHVHLPIHGVSSSSACKKCDHTCSWVPMTCNVNNHKQFRMCSCHPHEHQSLMRYSDQYLPHHRSCEHQSNSSEMLNAELNVRDDVEGVNPHLQSPLESTVRHVKGRLGYPIATATGHSHQQQSQNCLSEAQPSSMFHSHSRRREEKNSPRQFNVGPPETHQPQDRANIDRAEKHLHKPAPAEPTMRHAQYQPAYSGNPMTDDFSDQEECQAAPSESSISLDHSDQPRDNDTQHEPISTPPVSSLPQDQTHNADFAIAVRKYGVRGPTKLLKWLYEGKRLSITTNELGQPVGPNAPKLISFLGVLARDGHLTPLNFADWRSVPNDNKEKMWREVQEKFEIDPNSKRWVVKSLSKKWKDWKSKLKNAHYITHTTDEERLADRDERVLPDQWAYLVSHWSSEAAEIRSARNKANRAKQKFGHVTGTKSFARIREEQRAQRPDGKPPSRAELFILTRTRKDGKPVNEASSAVITQLREVVNQQNITSENSSGEDNVFAEIIGRDTNGHVRCVGLGPSPSGYTQAEASKVVTNAEVREMKERLVAMEQTCAQMAQQMSVMMSMMSSMQNNASRDDNNVPPPVHDATGTSEVSPEQQVQSTSVRRSSRRTNI